MSRVLGRSAMMILMSRLNVARMSLVSMGIIVLSIRAGHVSVFSSGGGRMKDWRRGTSVLRFGDLISHVVVVASGRTAVAATLIAFVFFFVVLFGFPLLNYLYSRWRGSSTTRAGSLSTSR